MLDGFSLTVLLAATGVAVLHSAMGPDHYLPFVALAHARRWSRARTLSVTAVCGVAHILSSLVLCAALVGVGASLGLLESIEESRGSVAAWAFVAFGLTYALWGARNSWRERQSDAGHHHSGSTFWALFTVFVLGPCEPLIALVFLPAADGRWALAGVTAAVFGAATVVTMVLLVGAALAGTQRLPHGVLERWAHPTAGLVLALSGVGMLVGL